MLAGFVGRGRPLPSALLYGAGIVGSLSATLLEGWLGPASYLLDPFLGIWPGPIYDEALALDRRLLLFRLGTLAWTAVMLGAAAAVASRRRTPPSRSRTGLLVVALGLLAVGALRVVGARTGDLATRAGIDRVLGGRLTGARCDLHYPREKPAADAERLFRDCEADVAEVAAALGVAHPPLVKVWVHRSAEEKRRLVGAGRTEFTKPWLAEIQVLDAPGGPPALRHEIVHAVGGAVAGGPLGVPARYGVLVDAGLVEGLAVALEVPRGDWTVHEWARAMKDLGLLPRAAHLVEPAGFFSAPAARAYGASGSFLAFLIERRGPAAGAARLLGGAVRRGLRRADRAARGGLARLPRCASGLAGAVGRRRGPVPPGRAPGAALRTGDRRPRGPGPGCRQAGRAGRGRGILAPGRAPLRRPLGSPEPGRRAPGKRPQPRRTRPTRKRSRRSGRDRRRCGRRSSRRAGTWPGAPVTHPRRQRATARRWSSTPTGRADGCSSPRSAPRPTRPSPPPRRGSSAERATPVRPCGRSPTSSAPLGPYLAGRYAAGRGDPAAAIPLLERALEGGLPSVAFRVEALSTLAAARCRLGDVAGAREAWSRLEATTDREADRERARHAAVRCGVEHEPAKR